MNMDDIVVEIRAENRQLLTALNQTNGKLDDFARQSTRAGSAGTSAFNSMGAAAMRLAGPLALGALAKGLYEGITAALEYADTIADTSKRLGMAAEAYQELSFAAKQSGVEQTEFNTGMRQMNNLIGEAISGNKEAAAKFTDLGISIEQIKNLKPEDAFMLISNALKNVTSDTQRAAAAADIYGGRVGAGIAAMSRDGAEAINELRKQARELGIVLSDEVVKNAGEMNDKFDAAKQAIGVEFKAAMLEVAPILISLVQWIAKGAKALNDWMAGFKKVENLSLDQAREELREINQELEGLKNAAYVEPSLPSTERWGAEAAYEGALARKAALERKIRAARPGRGGKAADITPEGKPTFSSKQDKPKKEEVKEHRDAQAEKAASDTEYFAGLRAKYMDDDSARKKKYADAQLDLTTLLEQGIISYEEYTKDTEQLDREFIASHVDAQTEKAAADAEYFEGLRLKYMDDDTVRKKRYAEAQLDLTTLLEQGIISYEEYTRDKQQLDAVFLDSTKSTTEQMLEQWAKLSENLDEVFGDALNGAADAFADLATTGKANVQDLEKAVIKSLIKIMLRALAVKALGIPLGGGKTVGSFLGIGSGKAGGGTTQAGVPIPVGERGPEVFVPHSAGKIVPNYALGGGAQPVVNIEVINNGTPQQVSSATAQQTPEGLVATVILQDLKRGGSITQGIKGRFGLRNAT